MPKQFDIFPKESLNEDFHKVAKQRVSAKRQLLSLGAGSSRDIERLPKGMRNVAEAYKTEFETADETAKRFKIEDYGNLTEAKRALRSKKTEGERSEWVDEEEIEKELGNEYDVLCEAENDMTALENYMLRALSESKKNSYDKKVNMEPLKVAGREMEIVGEKIRALRIAEPLVARAFDLIQYKKGTHEAGHLAPVPSVKKNFKEIGLRMASGKPMFLHGPTGSGKTSLAKYCAFMLSGKNPEVVYCNPQTRETNIYGRPGIKPAGKENASMETYIDYGPLAVAAKMGKQVVFDEFTSLPKMQMSMIKGIMNAKVGDVISIPGGESVRVAPGFQMVFTANLKSVKNPERQDLPPEMANEFDQNNIEVPYLSVEEAYDIALSKVMEPDGGIDLSRHDLEVTLPKLCEAFRATQDEYLKDNLKKIVLNQRTFDGIAEGWEVERLRPKHRPFGEFLDDRLKTSLTFKEYPESDRLLAAQILTSKGFLTSVTSADLGFSPDAFAVHTNTAPFPEEEHFTLREVAELDPWKGHETAVKNTVEDFLKNIEEKAEKKEEEPPEPMPVPPEKKEELETLIPEQEEEEEYNDEEEEEDNGFDDLDHLRELGYKFDSHSYGYLKDETLKKEIERVVTPLLASTNKKVRQEAEKMVSTAEAYFKMKEIKNRVEKSGFEKYGGNPMPGLITEKEMNELVIPALNHDNIYITHLAEDLRETVETEIWYNVLKKLEQIQKKNITEKQMDEIIVPSLIFSHPHVREKAQELYDVYLAKNGLASYTPKTASASVSAPMVGEKNEESSEPKENEYAHWSAKAKETGREWLGRKTDFYITTVFDGHSHNEKYVILWEKDGKAGLYETGNKWRMEKRHGGKLIRTFPDINEALLFALKEGGRVQNYSASRNRHTLLTGKTEEKFLETHASKMLKQHFAGSLIVEMGEGNSFWKGD